MRELRRYPLAPLAAAVGLSEHTLCVRLRLSGSTEVEYRERGVTERVADRLAVAVGFDPYAVWPRMLDDIAADVAAAERAEDEKRAERQRTRWRRAYARSAKVRDRKRAAAANYYAENGAYVRARERRRYAAAPEAARARAAAYYEANRDEVNARRRARYAQRRRQAAEGS